MALSAYDIVYYEGRSQMYWERVCIGDFRPNADLLRSLLCRECKRNDMFTVSLLKYWAQEYADKLAELLHSQLTRSSGTPKRKGHRYVCISIGDADE